MASINCWATGDVTADARKYEFEGVSEVSVWLRVGSLGYVVFSIDEARAAVNRMTDALTQATEMQGEAVK